MNLSDIATQQDIQAVLTRLNNLEQELLDIKGQLAQWVRASEATRLAGLTRQNLKIERERPGTLVRYRKEGRVVWYDRQSCLDHAKAKRLPRREREQFKAGLRVA